LPLSKTISVVEGQVDRSHVAIVIPTYNAEKVWPQLNAALRLQGVPAGQILIIDSSSEDRTADLATAEGYKVTPINRSDFNHGATRQLAVEVMPWAHILVYLTQDAVPADANALNCLLSAFQDSSVAAAYGRQLPRPGAGPIEAHARIFNYPATSEVRDFESRHKLGIKAAFLSNSFSAYRVRELCAVGGFPSDVIMAEDAVVAGRLLLSGRKIAYVAEACVYHSHPFTIAEEFRRYFDTGVYHCRETWLRERFGTPGQEGNRFVISELKYLAASRFYLVPLALLRTVSKALGYQLGLRTSTLGDKWSRRLSCHKGFWDRQSRAGALSLSPPSRR
jgi:rhamnosyltransferase